MFKKFRLLLYFCVAFVVIISLTICFIFFYPQSHFNQPHKTIYIRGGSVSKIIKDLEHEQVLKSPFLFKILYKVFFKNKKIKIGKYSLSNKMSNLKLLLTLIRGNKDIVKITINRLRTKTEFIKIISKNLNINADAFQAYLNSNDSLAKFNVDTISFFTMIIPNTYFFYWNTTMQTVLEKMYNYKEKFKSQVLSDSNFTQKHISFETLYILASIVEEESNIPEDKKKIASVYLNRLRIGMALQADPTVKFALQNFGLKRVLKEHLKYSSPFNTYLNSGLPIGPICTPSITTLKLCNKRSSN